MTKLNEKQNERLKAYLKNEEIKKIINDHLHTNGLVDIEVKNINFTPRGIPCNVQPPPPPEGRTWVKSFGSGICIWELI
jgi:hypothetical protein